MSRSAGRVLIMPQGEYDATKQYQELDLVTYNGAGYVAKRATKGNDPLNTAYWQPNGGALVQNLSGFDWRTKNRLCLRFSNLAQLQERLDVVGVGNETMIYLNDTESYYNFTARSDGDTEATCIFVSATKKLVPMPVVNNSISIMALGGVAGDNSAANAQKLADAIRLAIANKWALKVPVGKFYIDQSITVSNDLTILGTTTMNADGRIESAIGSALQFSPASSNISMFVDSGTHNVTISDVNFLCDYTHFASSTEESSETPHAYLTWSYDYTNVNCLNLPSSRLSISNVGIIGFSGYGLTCAQNVIVDRVKVLLCKYGIYSPKTDAIFNSCYVSRCEYAFYWSGNGALVLAYNIWIDLCGYGFYSEYNLTGMITGLIDHCLYAGIYALQSTTSLKIDCRMGRCGMYYVGTDMLQHAPSSYTRAAFDDMSKGVFIAIKNAKALDIKVNFIPRPIADSGVGDYPLPTLFFFGDYVQNVIIQTAYNLKNATYYTTDKRSEICVNTSEDVYLKAQNAKLYKDNGLLLTMPYYEKPKTQDNVTFSITPDGGVAVKGSTAAGKYPTFTMLRGIDALAVGKYKLTCSGMPDGFNVKYQFFYINAQSSVTEVATCYKTIPSVEFEVTSEMVGHVMGIRILVTPNTTVDCVIYPQLEYAPSNSNYIASNKDLTEMTTPIDITSKVTTDEGTVKVVRYGKIIQVTGSLPSGVVRDVQTASNLPTAAQTSDTIFGTAVTTGGTISYVKFYNKKVSVYRNATEATDYTLTYIAE